MKNKHKAKYNFRILLPLTIFWTEYLPEKADDWIKYETKLGEDEFEISIGIGIRSDHTHFNTLAEDLSKICSPTNSIWIYIGCYWSINLKKTLAKDIKRHKTTIYHDKLKNVIREVYRKLIDLIRNYGEQYWINPNDVNDENIWNLVQWEISPNDWIDVFPKSIHLDSRLYFDGISKEKWKEISQYFVRNKRVNMVYTMIANALHYTVVENGRMAVVEACTALEASIKQSMPVLLDKISDNKLKKSDIDKAIKKLGFSQSMQLLFGYFSKVLPFDDIDMKNCLDLINERNNVIHNKARYIHVHKAKGYINSVKNIVKLLSANCYK